jgi:hypothetical protein
VARATSAGECVESPTSASDPIHFSTAGSEAMGRRMASQLLGMWLHRKSAG